jgi:GntR family transcriptional repressor for pyruvate dehydrogenase complex
MAASFKPVKSATLPQVIAEQIITLIAEGRFEPGERLPTETELTQQFGVGRSTVREALKSLAMVGIVETRRSTGTYVSRSYGAYASNQLSLAVRFSERELRDIVEVRRGLESQTAALAAERATPEQIERLAELVAAMRNRKLSGEQMTEYDTAFHVVVAEASHNVMLHNLILSIRNLLRDYMRLGFATLTEDEDNVTVHERILEAIQARRPDQARQAMLAHLDASTEWIMNAAREWDLRRARPGAAQRARPPSAGSSRADEPA